MWGSLPDLAWRHCPSAFLFFLLFYQQGVSKEEEVRGVGGWILSGCENPKGISLTEKSKTILFRFLCPFQFTTNYWARTEHLSWTYKGRPNPSFSKSTFPAVNFTQTSFLFLCLPFFLISFNLLTSVTPSAVLPWISFVQWCFYRFFNWCLCLSEHWFPVLFWINSFLPPIL